MKPIQRAMGATRLKTNAIARTTFSRALREPMPVRKVCSCCGPSKKTKNPFAGLRRPNINSHVTVIVWVLWLRELFGTLVLAHGSPSKKFDQILISQDVPLLVRQAVFGSLQAATLNSMRHMPALSLKNKGQNRYGPLQDDVAHVERGRVWQGAR